MDKLPYKRPKNPDCIYPKYCFICKSNYAVHASLTLNSTPTERLLIFCPWFEKYKGDPGFSPTNVDSSDQL